VKLATEFFTGGKDTRSSENPPVLTFSLNNDVENRAVTVITTDESKRVKLSTVGWLFDMSLVGPYCHTISLLTATVVELHPEDGGCHSQCPRRCKLSNPRSQVLHNYARLAVSGPSEADADTMPPRSDSAMQFSCSLPISLPRCGDYCVPGDAPTSGICGAWDRQDRCRVSWVCGRHSAQCPCVENTEWGASWTSPTDSLDLKTR